MRHFPNANSVKSAQMMNLNLLWLNNLNSDELTKVGVAVENRLRVPLDAGGHVGVDD